MGTGREPWCHFFVLTALCHRTPTCRWFMGLLFGLSLLTYAPVATVSQMTSFECLCWRSCFVSSSSFQFRVMYKQNTFYRLQKVKFAAIFGLRKFDHVSDLRTKLGWSSLRSMSDYQTLVIAYKVIQCREPEELAALFVANSAIRER